jgi:uncharacterized protein (TIGR03435 family)
MALKTKEILMITKAIIGAGLVAAWTVAAYAQDSKAPEFEAASIKVAEPLNIAAMAAGGKVQIRLGCNGGPGTQDPGRFTCNGTPLRMLLMRAYGLKNYQVIGPNTLDTERFDIAAKIPEGTSADQFNLMLQKLLTDRFQMTAHKENKELNIYALTVGKNGHKLKEPKEGDDKDNPFTALADGKLPPPPPGGPGGGGGRGMVMFNAGGGAPGKGNGIMMSMRNGLNEMIARKATVQALADMLGNQMNRPVLNQTGIEGEWDFTLDFAPDENMRMNGPMGAAMAQIHASAGVPPPGADSQEPSGAPSIFTAVQNQLGLKLDPKKGQVEALVVDKVEKTPTEN